MSVVEPKHCPCGHVESMCLRLEAAKWCPPTEVEAERDALKMRVLALEEALREIARFPDLLGDSGRAVALAQKNVAYAALAAPPALQREGAA